MDQLIVNNTSDACPEVVTQPSEVTKADDDESTSGGAKSRRKNSKFLEREQRQAPTTRSTSTMSTTAATIKNPTLLTTVDNEDETFEKLATEQSSTKLVSSSFNYKKLKFWLTFLVIAFKMSVQNF